MQNGIGAYWLASSTCCVFIVRFHLPRLSSSSVSVTFPPLPHPTNRTYYLLFQLAVMRRPTVDDGSAKEYMAKALENAVLFYGESCSIVDAFKALDADPSQHPLFGQIEND